MSKPAKAGAIVALYFLPTAVALARRHRNGSAVAALNLFAGWTIIGWVICMIWAAIRDPSST